MDSYNRRFPNFKWNLKLNKRESFYISKELSTNDMAQTFWGSWSPRNYSKLGERKFVLGYKKNSVFSPRQLREIYIMVNILIIIYFKISCGNKKTSKFLICIF